MVLLRDIFRFVDAVAADFKPRQIILFGSYAYGEPTEDSDVDLLVIMPYRGASHHKAIKIRQAISAAFPLDLIVRSQPEITRRIKWNDFFLKEVMAKGVTLYAPA